MLKPSLLTSDDDSTRLGSIFGTPLVIKGWSWLPVNQVGLTGVLTWLAGKRHPDWSRPKRLAVGALQMAVILGSEWGHNLAHAAAAHWVGKPMDALRIVFGMPFIVYFDVNDRSVTPRQHQIRALGGPLFSTLMLPLAWLARHFSRTGSGAREVADAALAANTFIAAAGLTPIPMLDGGPIVKWSLVERGKTPKEADAILRKVNLVSGAGLAAGAGAALHNRRRGLGLILALLALSSFLFGLGLLKEQET